MDEQKNETFFDTVIGSFWACLPEESANNLANFKKDILKGFRSAADSFVDSEIAWTDHHLEIARRMRAKWDAEERAQAAEDVPPNPA